MEYERTIGWPPWTPAVKWLCIVNTVVFAFHAISVGFTHDDNLLPGWFGVSGANLVEGYGLGFLRLFSYQFLHAFVPPSHWFFNMLLLYFMGTAVEDRIGARRLVALYLAGGLIGGLLEVGLGLLVGRPSFVIGASGSCYAVLIYAACVDPSARVWFIVFPMTMRVLAWLLVGLGVYMTYANVLGPYDRTAHGAHLGGALWGYLTYRYRLEPARLVDRLAAWRDQRGSASKAEHQETLDRLLEKVHREGLPSLTPAERRFLDRQSRDLRGR